jgi:hypothetical protein
MHAKVETVVQALAEQGVSVSEALVALARIELLKRATQHSAPKTRTRKTLAVQCCWKVYPQRGDHA